MTGSFADTLFNEEPVGTFKYGHVFINAPDLMRAQLDPRGGYWRCDITDDDRLSWSDMVCRLFGLPAGSQVKRDWAVARYAEPSRSALELVRAYALSRKLGFILDAEISPQDGGNRWIRIMAVPILAKGEGGVVGLHGLKRPL